MATATIRLYENQSYENVFNAISFAVVGSFFSLPKTEFSQYDHIEIEKSGVTYGGSKLPPSKHLKIGGLIFEPDQPYRLELLLVLTPPEILNCGVQFLPYQSKPSTPKQHKLIAVALKFNVLQLNGDVVTVSVWASQETLKSKLGLWYQQNKNSNHTLGVVFPGTVTNNAFLLFKKYLDDELSPKYGVLNVTSDDIPSFESITKYFQVETQH